MSDMQTPADPDGPLMRGWTAWQQTDDYANTKRWATHPSAVEGSLWGAYERGFADGLAHAREQEGFLA